LIFGARTRLSALIFCAAGQADPIIPESARYEHDKQHESPGGNPPSDHQKSELRDPVPITQAAI
jgi:hypothetical protein